jgi:hypothetical protein
MLSGHDLWQSFAILRATMSKKQAIRWNGVDKVMVPLTMAAVILLVVVNILW